MSANPAKTLHSIAQIIANRWSARAIDPHRPVNPETLMQLFEAARWAPSCFGEQPWRYVYWDKTQDAEGWEQAASIVADGNQAWARCAPVLILACAAKQFSRNGKPNRWSQYDTGAATENLHLQGVELGLVVHQMGGFSSELAQQRFNIPDDVTPMAMIAVGYPGKLADLPEGQRNSETSARERSPLEQWVFNGTWPAN